MLPLKKYINIKRTALILLLISFSLFLFVGCKSKTNEATTSGTPQKRGNFDPAVMKTRYEDALKALVSDGTITQIQSDKVLEAMTKNVPKDGAGNPPQIKEGAPKDGKDKPSDGQNRGRNNSLSGLVTSGDITQAQADTIMQKLRGDFKPSQDQNKTQP